MSSSFDQAVAAARRDAEFLDHTQQSQQRWRTEFDEKVTAILVEAAQQFRQLPVSRRIRLVRPKKRFERAHAVVESLGDRFVVLDDWRCWIVPPYGNRDHGADIVFTEHAGLVAVTTGYGERFGRLISADPNAILLTRAPWPVDVSKEFAHGQRNLSGEGPGEGALRALRSALAQCLVEYDRAARAGESIDGLFCKHPIQWRR
ncbi:hypothetical protein ACWDSJ_28320 [Nocardia sp. NPDC003482]